MTPKLRLYEKLRNQKMYSTKFAISTLRKPILYVQYNFFSVLEGSTIVLEGSIFKWNFFKAPWMLLFRQFGVDLSKKRIFFGK